MEKENKKIKEEELNKINGGTQHPGRYDETDKGAVLKNPDEEDDNDLRAYYDVLK